MSTVLIVDDEQALAKLFDSYLNKHGYSTLITHTAEEALKIISSECVDIVIADIQLPGMDGLEFTKKVVNECGSEVIVVTGHSDEDGFMKAISVGATDFMIKPIQVKELLGRIQKAEKVRNLRLENAKFLELLKNLAVTDELTRLNNFRKFNIEIDEECKRASRYNHNLSLIYLDIDDFKIFNDTYGHVEGDKVLRSTAQVITDNLREHDSAYRYGGEEFTIILPETNVQQAELVAERLRTLVHSEKFKPNGYTNPIYITISIGVTEYINGEDSEEFIARADEAMYKSKQNGKNQITKI